MESRCLFMRILSVIGAIADLVVPVGLLEPHHHPLGARAREVLADVVGADRELAVPAVDEYGEPHRRGPAEVVHRVEGGADRASGEEHVVDEDDDLAVDAAGRHLGVVRAAGRAVCAGRRGTS